MPVASFDQTGPDVLDPLVWPTALGLPRPRVIAKALRPLTATVESPWQRSLDEPKTAAAAAETRFWLPQWRPEPWHPFEVVLVVDSSSSMEIWQHTVREFRDLMAREDAFHDVRTYTLDCSVAEAEKMTLRTSGGVTRRWRALVDPTGRRLVVVVTDTVGAAWRTGAAEQLLARWGRSMPIAVVQAMPQRLWHWGGLTPRRMRISADFPGVPNSQLRVWSESGQGQQTHSHRDVVVPVLALEPTWLSNWSRLFAVPGTSPVNLTAVFVSQHGGVDTDTGDSGTSPDSAHDLVRKFRVFSSVDAFRLAGLLAAAPLNLATIGLVQRILLPGAGLDAQAEVLLGGLLRRLPVTENYGVLNICYDFRDGVREQLLQGMRRSEIVRVARLIDECFGEHIPALRNFRAALDDPDSTELPSLEVTAAPFLRLQEAVFKALSGPYAPRAKAVKRLTDSTVAGTAVAGPAGLTYDHRLSPAPGSDDQESGSVVESDVHDEGKDQTLTTTQASYPGAGAGPSAGGIDVTAPGHTQPQLPDVTRSAGTRQPRIWGDVMPLRNPDFVGRIELLERLRQRLAQPGATAVLPEALHGLGGVGKSQTVAEYIYRHAGEYDVVWWIAAEHPTQIRNSLVELGKRLGITTGPGADVAVPAVLEALRRGEPYSRWILVFDNADRPDDVKDFLPGGSGHIVVTSRNSLWVGVARTLEVDLFTRNESTELLRRRGGAISDEEADRLATALGDLPLAIEQAATWRAQTGMPVKEYLGLLESNRTELLQMGTVGDYQLPVAAAWNVPLRQLRTDHPEALALLEVCAFFGPEPISRRVFSGASGLDVPDALRVALSDPIKLNSAIREISRYSLAKIDHRNNTLQLHRLVQAVLKTQVSEEDRAGLRHVVHLLLVHGDPNGPTDLRNWGIYAELLPHAIGSQAIECEADWVRELLLNLVRYLRSIGDNNGARELSQQAWQSWRELVGENDLKTLQMALQYGLILRRQLRFEQARELNKRTYDQLLSEFGEDNIEVLDAADVVALDLRGEGKFIEELALRKDIYERAQRIVGPDDPETLRYGLNLASCMRQVGDYFGARDLDDDLYRRRLVVHGPVHQATFRSLNAFAMDLRECGQYVQACDLEEDALNTQRQELGDDHPDTLGGLRNLAVARRKAGNPEGALSASRECHERYQRRWGDLHVDTITSLMNMSVDLRQLGELAESCEHGETCLQRYRQLYGPDHPYVHMAATNLSVAVRLLGDGDRARQLNRQALDFYQSAFGPDHPDALVTATNLASDLAELGRTAEAQELDADTFDRAKRVLGEEHPTTLAVALNLALDYKLTGRTDESASLHDNVVDSFRNILGANHSATIAAAQKVRANCDTDTMQL